MRTRLPANIEVLKIKNREGEPAALEADEVWQVQEASRTLQTCVAKVLSRYYPLHRLGEHLSPQGLTFWS